MSRALAEQIILAAADYMERNPEAWTKSGLAVDANGKPVDVSSGNAVRFCALGSCGVRGRAALSALEVAGGRYRQPAGRTRGCRASSEKSCFDA
jgi:hypothetical protein